MPPADPDRIRPDALAEVAGTLVYDQLRRLARRYVSREPVDVTVEATALVHEVYLMLCGSRRPQVNDQGHFLAICARLMRQILVTHARRRHGRRRAHSGNADLLDRVVASFEERCPSLDALDTAMQRLHEVDPRKAAVVELRFFAGVDEDQAAEILDVSTRTVRREWTLARAWLRAEVRP
jgi:RNA polymerase sigma-70 factor (ECF subfamily)